MPTILFESADVAREVAYILRGEWDGLNGVTVQNLDKYELELVTNQGQLKYCSRGAVCYLSITSEELLSQYNSGIRDFQGAYLSFLDLSGVNLTGINLADANLAQANLQGTNLEGANLRDTDLTGANLVEANLTGADLTFANLRKAILSRAKLTNANWRNAFYKEEILDDSNKLFVNLFIQDLFYELKKLKNIRHFGYLYGWLNIFMVGTGFVIAIIHLPLLTIASSVIKGIAIGVTMWLFPISLLIILEFLSQSKGKLVYIPLESLVYILVLGLILSTIGELNYALRETGYMFITIIVGNFTAVGSILSTLNLPKRMILS